MTPSSRPRDLAPAAPPLPLGLPAATGVRLEMFQLLNWGTFDGSVETLPLRGANALLTGQVGSGKSTIVDALTTLFAPTQKVTFNRAAGADRSERTVATYVLGHYRHVYDEATGGTRAEALRSPKGAYTALLATFTGVAGTPDRALSAGAAFWFPDGATAPHRLYFLVPARLDVATHLAGHRDPRAVRTALRAAGAELYDNNFRGYQKALCRYLRITPAALELLVQTVSMKQVGNLTEFVRAHMLDTATTDTAERIDKILNHYADLTRAHELVKVARDQLAALVPVAEHAASYDRAEARIAATTAAVTAVPAHVEAHRISLLDAEIRRVEHELPTLHARVGALRTQVDDEERQLRQLDKAIEAGGGAELTAARHAIDAATDTLAEVRRAYDELRRLAAAAGVTAPDGTDDYPRFTAAVATAAAELTGEEAAIRQADFDAQSVLAEARRELDTLKAELAAAGTRDSNVPVDDAALRDTLARELRLPAAALPFAAELIAVGKDSTAWESAAERLVRPFALSLLVPEAHYSAVAAWVDNRDLGRRLTYFRVPPASAGAATPRAGTMAAHLQVRPGTPVSDWLRAEVNRRYDHVCVLTAAELGAHQRAVTINGQVKDNTRHEKDDRPRSTNRRFYVLGWDTAARRATLLADIPGVENRIGTLITGADRVGQLRTAHNERAYAIRQVQERFTDPVKVDVARAHAALVAAQQLYDTLAGSVELATLLGEQQTREANLALVRGELSKADRRVGAAEDRLDQYQRLRGAANTTLSAAPATDLAPDAAEALTDAVAAVPGPPGRLEECDSWRHAITQVLNTRADSARSTRERASQRLVAAMKDFEKSWPAVVSDIPSDPAARGEYLALRDRLETDDLPRWEAQFKDQLERNAIHELVAFSAYLERGATDITRRIDTINTSLGRIDYRPGTYIRLEAERSTDPVVRDFRAQLRDITANATFGGDDADTYAETRFLKVKDLLDRFRGREGHTAADAAWTARVTDVRTWFSFAVSERDRAEDTELEHYSDSAGKSGGQKEKLAYTILAASLSYQYGLAGGDPDAFRFVMIDEAFGRGSDDSTRFGLDLFTGLGLQLLVVTPLQKIGTIEPYVEAVGFVTSDEQRSHLHHMTVREVQEQRAAHRAALLTAPAAPTAGRAAGNADDAAAVDAVRQANAG